MHFLKERYPPRESEEHQNKCILSDDNWDDFFFKTSFAATLFDSEGKRYDLGMIKIMSKGLKTGRVSIPNKFEELGESFCSLGADRDYYLQLTKIPEGLRKEFLEKIRDCVANPTIWHDFKNEEAMLQSLLRNISELDVELNLPRVLSGFSDFTPYSFNYIFQTHMNGPKIKCDFRVKPGSMPPNNIHVLIGRNGIGKTRLLAGMADALTGSKAATIGLPGRFEFGDSLSKPKTDFLNVVVVAFSVFDRLNPISTSRTKTSIPYQYIGIKKFSNEDNTDEITLKSSENMTEEFKDCFESILSDKNRIDRWVKSLEILESDPGLREINFSQTPTNAEKKIIDDITNKFEVLSSGHKIVLLTITKLVELISDRSLVLIDEPETHLHPPLLGSFMRALSNLLITRNGVAILATHSPVVLQEVPSNCVSILRRSGDVMRIERPNIETFAENVSALTRKVFGLEVEESGFFKLLSETAKGRDYPDIIEHFNDQLGAEGRALARAFTSKGNSK